MDVDSALSVGDKLFVWFGPGGFGLAAYGIMVTAVLLLILKNHRNERNRIYDNTIKAFDQAADLAEANAESRTRWAVAMEGFKNEVTSLRESIRDLTLQQRR